MSRARRCRSWLSISLSHGGEIARIAPNLAARVGALPLTDAVDPETSRRLLFEAIADLVRRASRIGRCCSCSMTSSGRTATRYCSCSGSRTSAKAARSCCSSPTDPPMPTSPRYGTFCAAACPPVGERSSVDGLSPDGAHALLEAAAGHDLGDEGTAVATLPPGGDRRQPVVRGRARTPPRRDRRAGPGCRGALAHRGRPRGRGAAEHGPSGPPHACRATRSRSATRARAGVGRGPRVRLRRRRVCARAR